MTPFLKKCKDCGDWRQPDSFRVPSERGIRFRSICRDCLRIYNARASKAYKQRKRLGLKAPPRVYVGRECALFTPDRTPYTPAPMFEMGEPERGVALVASIGLPALREAERMAA